MILVFNPLEPGSLGEAVTAAAFIALDEEFNWLECATLCAINAIAALALLFS